LGGEAVGGAGLAPVGNESARAGGGLSTETKGGGPVARLL
jgi:hypothetical protein